MRKMLKLGTLILITALVFFGVMSCKKGVTIDVKSLDGETILYITDGNGKNYTTYTFNEDGTGGTWEWGVYTYDYPDQSAYDSSTYTDKEWFMNGGEKGTFSYNEETGRVTTTVTHVWKLKDGEGGPPPHFKNDYAWATYTEDVLGYGHPADDSASKVIETDTFFNYDTPMLIGYLSQGDDTNQWRYYEKTTESETEAGTTTVTVTEETTTYTITGTEVVRDGIRVETETVDGGTPTKETWRDRYTYTLNNFFIGGEDTGDTEFDKAWREGNEVTLLLEETKYEDIYYEGDSEPDPPSVIDDTTGIGTNSNGTYSYTVYEMRGQTAKWAFLHAGDAIFETYYFDYSYKGLK
jgi:hypothetical protein